MSQKDFIVQWAHRGDRHLGNCNAEWNNQGVIQRQRERQE